MKINSFSSTISISNKNNYSQSNFQVQTSNDQFELSKMKQILSHNAPRVADPQTNSINIKQGEVKNIGTVDGSPLNVYFNSDGMNTSFGAMVYANEPTDSPRNKLALDVFNSHTTSQRDKAGSISTRFRFLYSVANGSMSVNEYNATDLGQNAISTSELLTSLGIDVSKSFLFNGKSFSLDAQGDLHALLAPK